MPEDQGRPKPLADPTQVAPDAAGRSIAAIQLTAPRRFTNLPHIGGRDEELRRLDAAWDDLGTHVVSILAWGGTGRTSLVPKWAGGLAARGYDETSYFDWSFYSQGTRETGRGIVGHIHQCGARFFGAAELATSPASRWDKVARLAGLVAAQRTLLILDGMELLQYSPGPLAGQPKDPAVKAFAARAGWAESGAVPVIMVSSSCRFMRASLGAAFARERRCAAKGLRDKEEKQQSSKEAKY